MYVYIYIYIYIPVASHVWNDNGGEVIVSAAGTWRDSGMRSRGGCIGGEGVSITSGIYYVLLDVIYIYIYGSKYQIYLFFVVTIFLITGMFWLVYFESIGYIYIYIYILICYQYIIITQCRPSLVFKWRRLKNQPRKRRRCRYRRRQHYLRRTYNRRLHRYATSRLVILSVVTNMW